MSDNQFDPDQLKLTKSEILAFCDRILSKWNKDPVKNAHNILAMNAIKASVVWTDNDTLKNIWSEIVKWSFELLYENTLQEGVGWASTMKNLKSKK